MGWARVKVGLRVLGVFELAEPRRRGVASLI